MLKSRNILVHCDWRSETHPAVDYAAELAKANGGQVKIVDIIPDLSWLARQLVGGYERVLENITQDKARRIGEIAAELREQGVDATAQILDGRTSEAMIREVLRNGHDLVIKEAKGKHSRRSGFFGTTATRLLRECPCPVLIIEPDHPCRYERVVAAVSATPKDELHTELNQRIVRLAVEAATSGAPEIVAAWDIYGESILKSHMSDEEFADLHDRTLRHTQQQLSVLLKDFGLGVEDDRVHVLQGEPGEVIPTLVHDRQADLLVMGTVARSGVAGLLMGNTAEQILDRVACSVLAVKPEGFVSPVRL